MDNQVTSLETIQIGRVQKVLFLTSTGMYLKEALVEVGIAEMTYYKYVAEAIRARDELQSAKQQLELIEYADIISAQAHIMRKLIMDALSDDIFPGDRLNIKMYLDHRLDVLEDRNRPSGAGSEFLTGPVLAPGVSTHRDVSIKVGDVEITVSNTPDVLEGHFED